MLWVALHFTRLPGCTLEPIAAWACQFTPKVVLEPPRALVLEVAASLRHFGGRDSFLAKLRAGLGCDASLAVASTALAALWLCRGNARNLEELPLEATGFELGFFKSIGISTVGELMRLPREGLARRCGPALLDELDRASGRLPEMQAFFAPPRRFAARLELAAEATHAEALLSPARRLLVQLEGLLAARQEAVRGFVLKLLHHNSEFVEVKIELASPARDAERLAGLLRERLGATALSRPVEALALEAGDFTPLGERSAAMFGDTVAAEEDWARLVERLRARLGRDAVCGLAMQPDHRPEHAWRRVEPGEWEPREFRQPGARPLWLLDPPRRIAETQFALLAGPERIDCGWWDGDEARRDYFVAGLQESLAWVYREAGEWYLHGLFA